MNSGGRLVGTLTDLARRQPWLRERAGRAVDAVVAASRVPPPGLRPGAWARHLDRRADDLPVVLVDCSGLGAETLAELVESLPTVSSAAGGVRFVLVVDGANLATGRRVGVVVEHLVDAATWGRRHPEASWPAYRERRFEQMRNTYRPQQVVVLPSGDADQLRQAIGASRPAPTWRRLLARAERALDPPPRG